MKHLVLAQLLALLLACGDPFVGVEQPLTGESPTLPRDASGTEPFADAAARLEDASRGDVAAAIDSGAPAPVDSGRDSPQPGLSDAGQSVFDAGERAEAGGNDAGACGGPCSPVYEMCGDNGKAGQCGFVCLNQYASVCEQQAGLLGFDSQWGTSAGCTGTPYHCAGTSCADGYVLRPEGSVGCRLVLVGPDEFNCCP